MNDSPWPGRIQRGTSLRVLLGTFLGAAVIGWLLSLIWEPLIYVGVVLWPLFWLGNVLDDDKVTECPHCGKRVKYGYTTCHHCGKVAV